MLEQIKECREEMNENKDEVGRDAVVPTNIERFAQHGPPDKVFFKNVLGMDPRLNHTSVPFEYRSHPMIRGQFFYTIPQQLLKLVFEGEIGETPNFNRGLYELELQLSAISGDHSQQVGFWNDMPILFPLMKLAPVPAQDLTKIGLPEARAVEAAAIANQHFATFAEISGAYSGWLMTNSEFLSELDALIKRFSEQMRRWGTAVVGLPIPNSLQPGAFNPTGEVGWNEYDTAVLEFCIRWRLQGLAGPQIPIPMKPMLSGQFPTTVIQQLMRAGGVFNWPDTFPLFSRDVLRDLLASALRPSPESGHLTDWHKIIDVQNRAKNRFVGLERRFRLQHFWRLLRQRHPGVFNRRIARVERAFAAFFGVDESSIHADRLAIQRSLGKDWDQRAESV